MLLLHLQNGRVHCSSHLLFVVVVLLHIHSKLLRVSSHQIHDLIVHIRFNHLGIISVMVIVRLEVSGMDVVCHVPCVRGQIGKAISMLQSGVPQAS